MMTRLGFHFVFVAGFAMVGGALRGFNLLLVLAGVLVGALLMQWRYSRSMISGLSAQRRLPADAIAGKAFRLRYHVTNRGRFLPAWMFWIEDHFGQSEDRRTARSRRQDLIGKCAVGFLSPQSSTLTHVECVFSQRGQYRIGPMSIATTFPFSLLTARVISNESESFFVFPVMLDLRTGWEKNLLSRINGVMAGSQQSGMADGDFFGLREWQTGDNPRWIHWRTTARLGELAVRQFEQHRRFDVCLLVDGYDGSTNADQSYDSESDVELAISLAATIIARLGGQPSNRVSLAVGAKTASLTGQDRSSESQTAMLRQLAEVQPTKSPMLLAAIDQLSKSVGVSRDLIVLSSRSFAEASAAVEAESGSRRLQQQLAPWSAREGFRWLDVRDPKVKHWIGSTPNAKRLYEAIS